VKIEKERSTFADIVIEDFDEDAELQANMWNMLVRTDSGISGDNR